MASTRHWLVVAHMEGIRNSTRYKLEHVKIQARPIQESDAGCRHGGSGSSSSSSDHRAHGGRQEEDGKVARGRGRGRGLQKHDCVRLYCNEGPH